jgi:UDP:flavonoid glycosyltransferase YjiC (YdhE family)
VTVADNLRDSVQVRFSSYGEAASYASMRGYRCNTVPPVEFAWSSQGSFSIKHTLANIPLWFANLSRQVNQEARNLTMYSPDVIVSDSRLSPILAARLLRIPSIVVLNQMRLLLSPRLRQLAVARLFEGMVGEFLGSMWNMADRVLVPDLPPPYTISSHNVWGVGSTSKKMEYVGFMASRPRVSEQDAHRVAASLGLDRSKPVVFVHVSGPAETRMPLVRIALAAADQLPGVQFIFSEGKPGGSIEPRKAGPSAWYYEWCPVRDEIFLLSDLLVLRGGHMALSQAIQFGKPVVTIPIENHGEQLGNSEKAVQLGFGEMVHPKGLGPDKFAVAVGQVLAGQRYRKRAEELKGIAERQDGVENVVNIVRSYLK